MKTMTVALAAMALGLVSCAEVAADGAVLTNGFTLTLKVNLDGAKGDEKLYALGPMNLVLRQGQPSGYDVAGGGGTIRISGSPTEAVPSWRRRSARRRGAWASRSGACRSLTATMS